MCGIAGYFGISEEPGRSLLRKMCDVIKYRGPDEEGFTNDETAGLGIRRLSIIDLKGGHQPITNEDKNLWIVGNGEIYNFIPLREELKIKGHRFTTGSDIEVALHLYEEEGEKCLDRLNGMYGLAIWDKARKKLFLGRDRMGIKPLYYYFDGNVLLFASEIKSLFASGLVPKEIDDNSLWDYLTFRYVPQKRSIWNNVHKLLPAHWMTISVEAPVPKVERYWDIPLERPRSEGKNITHYTKEFSDLFLDAVRSHLVADVPVGVLLSGGLDSSAVACAIRETGNSQMDSFTVSFENAPALDERSFARSVADAVGMKYNEVVIGQKEFTDFLPDFVHYMDEPVADLASVPLYYVSRLAAQRVKVVMSGEGSDEILGGYHFNEVVHRWDQIRSYKEMPDWVRAPLRGISPLFGRKFSDYLKRAELPISASLVKNPLVMTNYFSSTEKTALLNGKTKFPDSLDGIREEYRSTSGIDPLQQLLYVHCQSWLVEDLLMKADRMTMANSIELRVPFLDYRLVEWSARVPSWVKVASDGKGRYLGKRVLRNFAASRLPAAIVDRPKMGFPVPVYGWLQNSLKQWAIDLLGSNSCRLYGRFDKKEIQKLVAAGTHEKGKAWDQQRLWQFLILEIWMQRWMSA